MSGGDHDFDALDELYQALDEHHGLHGMNGWVWQRWVA